ncbi:MAG: biotin/lipoyl-binding protein [Desulfobulbaceae bacterium]|nr:biotin/lipoyl-binding protein [Desulfobulbaceae bacterium]
MDTNRKRKLITLILLFISVVAVSGAWYKYSSTPWTRHGEVQADIINVAPRISGMVSEVLVKDNQPVKKGDVLFVIDPEPYQLVVNEAEVNLKQTRLEVDQLRAAVTIAEEELIQAGEDLQYSTENAQRIKVLSERGAASKDAADKARKRLAVAKAEVNRAEANLLKTKTALGDQSEEDVRIQSARIKLKFAQLDLSYTRVKATVNGFVVNVKIGTGDYGQAGVPLVAVVDEASLRISAMYRENQLAKIAVGDSARVVLMSAKNKKLQGKVRSLGTAIAPPETASANNLVPSIPAIFDWIRLPQRVPVIISLDPGQDTGHIIPGMTASVTVRR